MSDTISTILVILLAISVPYLCYSLVKYRSSFSTNYMRKRYSNIYMQFKNHHWSSYMHGAVFLLRRILFCIFLVFITDAFT